MGVASILEARAELNLKGFVKIKKDRKTSTPDEIELYKQTVLKWNKRTGQRTLAEVGWGVPSAAARTAVSSSGLGKAIEAGDAEPGATRQVKEEPKLKGVKKEEEEA